MKRNVVVNGRRVEVDAPNYLGSNVRPDVAVAFRKEALKRGVPLNLFIRRVLTMIVNGKLFEAVLDD
jgi:hypothetical protein